RPGFSTRWSAITGCCSSAWAKWRARARRSRESRRSSRCPISTTGPARSASPATWTRPGGRRKEADLLAEHADRPPVIRKVEVFFGGRRRFPALDLGAQREEVPEALPIEGCVRGEPADRIDEQSVAALGHVA